MVKLLSSLLASALFVRADQSCRAHDGECTGLDKPTLGASQLQLAASSAGSRGHVSEFGNVERQSGALDFENALSASLSSGQRLHAAAARVREAEHRMRSGYSPSVNEIDHLISSFDGHVSSSYDQCSTQLYELKHQLTVVSEEVTSIAVEVNSTEASIYTYEEACKEKTMEISVMETSHTKKVQRCITEKNTVKKTLSVLQHDLVDMKQISAAHIHVSTGGGNAAYGNGAYAGGSTGGYTGGISIGGGYSGGSSSGVSHTTGYSGGYSSGGYGGVSSSGVSHTSGYNGGYGSRYGGVSSSGVSHTSRGVSRTTGYNGGYSRGGGYGGASSNGVSHVTHATGYSGGYGGGHEGYGYRGLSLLEGASQSQLAPEQGEDSSPEGRQRRVDRVQSLVQQTKDIAQKASQCMAKIRPEAQVEAANTAEVFLEIAEEINGTAKGSPPSPCGPMPADCYDAKCAHGRWQCGSRPVGCGPMPTDCYDAKCIHGRWQCGSMPSPVLPNQCNEVIIELEHTFTVAYVGLTRLIEEYEVTTHSTVCEDSVETEYNKEITVVQSEATRVCKRVQSEITHLHQYQLQLTQTTSSKVTIEKNLQLLIKECGSLTETSTYLETVTGTIAALGNCPGLGDLSFALPSWVGSWAYVKQQGQYDADLDAAMLQICKQSFHDYGTSVRPAEVAELDEQSVQGMPTTNTAESPLLGACPLCEGDDAEVGHGRVCWEPGEAIGPDSKRGDCHEGTRAVLCVYEPSAKPANPTPY